MSPEPAAAVAEAPARQWPAWFGPSGLVLVSALVFGPLLGAPFLWDDELLIQASPLLGDWSQLKTALTSDFWAIGLNADPRGMYRPVVTFTYFVDRALFGASAVGPHVVNLLLHGANAALVARLARTLGSSARAALVAAALFMLHPATVEAVAHVASRTDVLATGLLLSALLLSFRSGTFALVGVFLLVVAAFLSKESAAVALPLVLLTRWAGGQGDQLRRNVHLGLVAAGATALVLLLRTRVLGETVKLSPTPSWKPVLSGSGATVRYVGAALAPWDLVPYLRASEPSWWAAALVVLAVVVAWVTRRRAAMLGFSVAWWVLTLTPVADWLPVGTRFSGLLLYLPLAGVAVGLGVALARSRVLSVSLPALLAIGSVTVVPHWSSAIELWSWNVEVDPSRTSPHLNLGNALMFAGDTAAARAQYEQALELATAAEQPNVVAMASVGLGVLATPRSLKDAEAHFLRARAAAPLVWQAQVNLAKLAAIRGRFPQAFELLEAQWAMTPVFGVAQAALDLAQRVHDPEAEARWAARSKTLVKQTGPGR